MPSCFLVVALARLTPLRRADGRLYAVGLGLWAPRPRPRCLDLAARRVGLAGLNAGHLICLGVAAAMFGAAAIATIVRARRPAGPIVPAS